jgi:hypothetical protein
VAARTLEAVGAIEVDLDEGTGWVLPDDLEPAADPGRWVALLPSLDTSVMGWKEREWYLGPHASVLFDRNGNAGPTVWADGRIVGGWAQTDAGEIVVELVERVDPRTRRAIDRERERLRGWLGDARIKARFPTALGRELAKR